VSRISRLVTDRDHVVAPDDDIDAPMVLPDGRRIVSTEMACNVAGAVGLPTSVFLDAGLRVHESWLAEVRDRRVVRWIGRVCGPHSLWPEDRPGYQAERYGSWEDEE
jgi:hypothetical protein